MCGSFELDDAHKRALKQCEAEAALPQLSAGRRRLAALRHALTSFVVGLHAGRVRIPERRDRNNPLF
jgi:hypothetical protein